MITTLKVSQCKTIVLAARRAEYANWEGAITTPPLSKISSSSTVPFLQFTLGIIYVYSI